MIRDALLQVSTAQALTTTAVSTDSIDLSSAATAGHGAAVGVNPHSIGTGEKIRLFVDVVTTLLGGTSVVFEIISASDAALTSDIEVLGASDAYLAADLVDTREPIIVEINPDPGNAQGRMQRYIGARYTIDGTFTSGAVDAGFLLDFQNARIFPASTDT